MARDRKRLAYLQNLSVWQETARRHAHEMKTPLTAARLELERLTRLVEGDDEASQLAGSVGDELSRLGRFTQQFTSFARLPQPRLESHEVGRFLAELVSTFGSAWGGMTLRLIAPQQELSATLDRDMLRQALVNLCDNSAQAMRAAGQAAGTVTLRVGETDRSVSIDVEDDGPGVPAAIRARVFEPYVTTRKIGEGMGLGLAIAKKILLDHGGDLDLLRSSPSGTVFRLTLPKAMP
jgi:nitrogen fixation/metabolism regulation signal transduction histidine kinase